MPAFLPLPGTDVVLEFSEEPHTVALMVQTAVINGRVNVFDTGTSWLVVRWGSLAAVEITRQRTGKGRTLLRQLADLAR